MFQDGEIELLALRMARCSETTLLRCTIGARTPQSPLWLFTVAPSCTPKPRRSGPSRALSLLPHGAVGYLWKPPLGTESPLLQLLVSSMVSSMRRETLTCMTC